jgi:capsular polysaccharide biosynthesis protein
MVSSSLVDETALLKISVSNGNPALAQKACDAVAQATAKYFSTVTGETSSAQVIGKASDAGKTAPNIVRNAILGALIGMILSVGVILARELLDNTIRDKTTLQMQIDVPVLGEIPSFTEAAASKGGKHSA